MKHFFELMQQQEIATRNYFPSKKELKFTFKKFSKELLDNGEIDKTEAFTQAQRYTDAITFVRDELKASLPTDKQIAFGMEFNPVNGRKMIQFHEDPIWQQLNTDLKEREELLKLAQRMEVPDMYGNIVPKVSVKYAADSLQVKY